MEGLLRWVISPMLRPPLRQHKYERQYTPSTHSVIPTRWIWNDDYDGQMIFRVLGGLKFPDICLTSEEKPRKNLTQETCPDRGSNPGLLQDKRACYHLLHSSGLKLIITKNYVIPTSEIVLMARCIKFDTIFQTSASYHKKLPFFKIRFWGTLGLYTESIKSINLHKESYSKLIRTIFLGLKYPTKRTIKSFFRKRNIFYWKFHISVGQKKNFITSMSTF